MFQPNIQVHNCARNLLVDLVEDYSKASPSIFRPECENSRHQLNIVKGDVMPVR